MNHLLTHTCTHTSKHSHAQLTLAVLPCRQPADLCQTDLPVGTNTSKDQLSKGVGVGWDVGVHVGGFYRREGAGEVIRERRRPELVGQRQRQQTRKPDQLQTEGPTQIVGKGVVVMKGYVSPIPTIHSHVPSQEGGERPGSAHLARHSRSRTVSRLPCYVFIIGRSGV